MSCAVSARGTIRGRRPEINRSKLRDQRIAMASKERFPVQDFTTLTHNVLSQQTNYESNCMQRRESGHHEKALDSEWEGTVHDKRKGRIVMTNKHKRREEEEAAEPREEGRRKETERTWVALFWVEICFIENYISHHHFDH